MKYLSPENREFEFNAHVCVEMLLGVPDEERTGRLVQVRKGVGAFGSDLYLIRLRTGRLVTFENVMIRHVDDRSFEEAFYVSNGRTPPRIPEQPAGELDAIGITYLVRDQWPETGFVIERPAQPPSARQSFAFITQSSRGIGCSKE